MSGADPPIIQCQQCGEVMAMASPGGVCPRCLMGGILGDTGESAPVDMAGATALSPYCGESKGPAARIDPLEGTQIGRYKLLQLIGEGGFGLVYMAVQVKSVNRRVALKIIKAGMDTKQVIARFEAERQALAMMDHPNIARMFDVGETDEGRPYFVMELVKGVPITTYCQEEKLDTQTRLNLFLQTCRAVQHAHLKGIIHRDLKPSNILITLHDGEPIPKVIDFGIAKAMDQQLTEKTLFTRYEHMIGTPAYMSPEQAALSGLDVDTRSDVYALGVLLYELLTGTTPFDAKTLREAAFDEMRRMIREDEPPKPSVRLTSLSTDRKTPAAANLPPRETSIPQDLDWIAMKALEKDRGRRYQTASSLAEDIESFKRQETVTAGPPGLRYKVGKFVRRNRSLVAASTIIVALLILGIAASTWGLMRAMDAEDRAATNLQKLQVSYEDLSSANEATELARQDAQRQLVERLLERGTEKFNEGECIELITLADAVTAASGAEDLERKAREIWQLARSWLPGGIETIIGETDVFALSHDESLISWWDESGLHFLQIDSGDVHSVPLDAKFGVHSESWANALLFSPADRKIALFSPMDGVGQIWDVATREPLTALLTHPDLGLAFDKARGFVRRKAAFSPNGRYFGTIAYNGTACLWDTVSGELATPVWAMGTPELTESYENQLAFSPSGNTLIVARPNLIRVVDLIPGAEYSTREYPSMAEPGYRGPGIFGLLVLDDSRLISAHVQSTRLWDLATGSILSSFEIPFKNVNAELIGDMALSRDGKTFAMGTRNGDARLCDTRSLEPRGKSLLHGGLGVEAIRFLADDRLVTCGGRSIQYWTTDNGHHHRFGKWPNDNHSYWVQTGKMGKLIATSSEVGAIVRRLPPKLWHRAESLVPEDGTIVDLTADGENLLVRSKDRNNLSVWNRRGSKIAQGPAIQPDDWRIDGARFTPQADAFVYSSIAVRNNGYDYDYRSWSIQNAQPGSLSGVQRGSMGCVFPTSPLSFVIEKAGWAYSVIDFTTGQTLFRSNRLSNQCGSSNFNAGGGWYGVGDKSGVYRRYQIADHEELLPSLKVDGSILYSACSGDGKWLLILFRTSEGAKRIRAWYVVGKAPFFNIQSPYLYEGEDRIFPVDERGFVFQQGQELRRFDLPEDSVPVDLVQDVTSSSIAAKRNEMSPTEYRMLTEAEFLQAKAVAERIK
ncbi:MAG: serine/threonine-protein kinase [Verrucomicrobiales bacterium]